MPPRTRGSPSIPSWFATRPLWRLLELDAAARDAVGAAAETLTDRARNRPLTRARASAGGRRRAQGGPKRRDGQRSGRAEKGPRRAGDELEFPGSAEPLGESNLLSPSADATARLRRLQGLSTQRGKGDYDGDPYVTLSSRVEATWSLRRHAKHTPCVTQAACSARSSSRALEVSARSTPSFSARQRRQSHQPR